MKNRNIFVYYTKLLNTIPDDITSMIEDILHRFNPWWKKDFTSPGILRERYLNEIDRRIDIQNILFLFGLRRVGKTTIMKQYISRKLEHFPRNRIFFASLDHPSIVKTSLMDLLREFMRMNKVGRGENILLVLDEVQHRPGFEMEMKAISDIDENLRIIASGSSSLVIDHGSAFLTGRYLKIRIDPLSFREYLSFINVEYDESSSYLMEEHMEDYLFVGGMPKYVLTRDPEVLINK